MQQRLATGDLQDAEAFVVQNEAVWVVVHDDKVVAQGKVYQFSYVSRRALAPVGMLG